MKMVAKSEGLEDWGLEFPELSAYKVKLGIFPKEWFDKILELPEKKKWSDRAHKLFIYGNKLRANRKELPKGYADRGISALRSVLVFQVPVEPCYYKQKMHVAGLILKSICARKEIV